MKAICHSCNSEKDNCVPVCLDCLDEESEAIAADRTRVAGPVEFVKRLANAKPPQDRRFKVAMYDDLQNEAREIVGVGG